MAYQSTTARGCFGAMLAITIAALFAACSGSGPGADEGAGRRNANSNATASAQPTVAPGAAASGATTSPAIASDAAETGAATAGADAEAGATVGGDGSEIVLAPLSAADIDGAALMGELACSFSIGKTAPLLFAMGDVASTEPSRGVVRVGDYVEAVAAPGGFDAMLKGVKFSGAGKTVRIALTGLPAGTGESPPVPATLTYDRADGARRSYAGQWQCGP